MVRPEAWRKFHTFQIAPESLHSLDNSKKFLFTRGVILLRGGKFLTVIGNGPTLLHEHRSGTQQ